MHYLYERGEKMLLLSLSSFGNQKAEKQNEKIERCILKLAEGDEAAFEELYNLTKESVYSFALAILKNTYDAEDVMHDCYINVYHGAESYKPNAKPLAWMLTITKNLCFGKLRKSQKREDIPQEDWEKFLEGKDDVSVEDKLVLRACMEILTDEEREIVVLHAVSGFKHREIAYILDMALSTVLSKYNRAVKKLKKQLEKESGTL